MRCLVSWPAMNVAKSEIVLCAELTETIYPVLTGESGWDFSQRAYMETAMSACSGWSTGVTLAAAMVPMSLTPIASSGNS